MVEKDLTVKKCKEWFKKIREENQEVWKQAEEIMKLSSELDIKRYELSGSTNRPISISYHASLPE